jgi:PAS domain S-box-containing protein
VDIEQPEWLQQMEGILETGSEGVIIADDCTRIILANSDFLEMTGISREELIGNDATSFYSLEETEVIAGQRIQAIKEGHNRIEFVVPRNDGSQLPAIMSSRAVEDPDGRHFGVLTFTGIRDQKRAEKQLREANAPPEERQREIKERHLLAARVQQSLAPKSLAWGD